MMKDKLGCYFFCQRGRVETARSYAEIRFTVLYHDGLRSLKKIKGSPIKEAKTQHFLNFIF